jgi:putative PIN family toxin of toxin-antitoxin system
MKVVIDTNVLLVSIPPSSEAHWLWQAVVAGLLDVYVTTDILLEYAEIIGRRANPILAEAVMDLLGELPNVHFTNKYYFWQLVEVDPDDNKFLDCAISAGANFLVSEDKHFHIIKSYPYFGVNLVKLKEFKEIFDNRFEA